MSENFEHIDHLLRNASEANNPAFNEAAWEKMNTMLDKEFGKKKRRFAILWWLLPLAIVSSIGYYLLNNKSDTITEGIAVAQQQKEHSNNGNQSVIASPEDKQNIIKEKSGSNSTASIQDNSTQQITNKTITDKDNNTVAPIIGSNTNIITNNKLSVLKKQKQNAVQPNNDNAVDIKNKQQPITDNSFTVNTNSVAVTDTKKTQSSNIKTIDAAQIKDTVETAITTVKKNDIAQTTTSISSTKTKEKNKALSKWSVSASMALDGSFIRLSEFEKATFAYGVGINYQLNKRWIIGTGFYAARKIYTAQRTDYDFSKTTPPAYYNYIVGIDADCYVFDIPVTTRYNFSIKPKTNWYVAAGVSSVIMKTEDYNSEAYYPTSGQTYYHPWSISNQNANLFSMLNLSVGFEKQISKQLHIGIEPYYKIPLTGIGQGSVKLSSLGVQLNGRFTFNKK
ncbi:MAG: hypothetical protein C0459_13270 [Chitinophaga sp.]|jgi:hypothetical protein|nr:hypothetical protein [Chitinophaga sp.]